ncbi:hypothetical protein F5B20DRAFT_115994 [Whalleya microplaca]|nr:hypothetical protein F5B20DRAFT_115994 [Whalleya microplaca]
MPNSNPWIGTTLLPPSATALGRLVEDITRPEKHFCDTFASPERPGCPKPIITESRTGSLTSVVTSSKSSSTSCILSVLLGSTFGFRKDEILMVSAEACVTRSISNSADYFSQASNSELIREWLEQMWRRREKTYMAVGIQSVMNAKITLKRAKSKKAGFRLGMPGSLVLQVATHGAIPTLGGAESLLDSEVGASYSEDIDSGSTFVLPGENIIAIQYRKVDFSWFRTPSSSNLGLKEELPWRVYLGTRAILDVDDGNYKPSDEHDIDSVTLRTEIGRCIQEDDIREFYHYESCAGNGKDEVWHVYSII